MSPTLDYLVIQQTLERTIKDNTGLADVKVSAFLDPYDYRWNMHVDALGTTWKFKIDQNLKDWQELEDLVVQLKLSA